jgi:Aminoglycoside-2''-adenylyltransferase
LEETEVPWYVAAGWAIDLYLGGDHREHEDLEIAVPNDRLDEIVAAFPELEFCVITDPQEATPLEDARDRLNDTHQTWAREPESGLWRFDVFREPSDGDTWLCRRDKTIRLPYERVIERTDDGIPYCRPEIALLFRRSIQCETGIRATSKPPCHDSGRSEGNGWRKRSRESTRAIRGSHVLRFRVDTTILM